MSMSKDPQKNKGKGSQTIECGWCGEGVLSCGKCGADIFKSPKRVPTDDPQKNWGWKKDLEFHLFMNLDLDISPKKLESIKSFITHQLDLAKKSERERAREIIKEMVDKHWINDDALNDILQALKEE